MGTQADNGGGYGLVPVMGTHSSRGDVLVLATGQESVVGKRKAMTCRPSLPFVFACLG